MVRMALAKELSPENFTPGIAIAIRCPCCDTYNVNLYSNGNVTTVHHLTSDDLQRVRRAGFEIVVASEHRDGRIRIDHGHPLGDVSPKRQPRRRPKTRR